MGKKIRSERVKGSTGVKGGINRPVFCKDVTTIKPLQKAMHRHLQRLSIGVVSARFLQIPCWNQPYYKLTFIRILNSLQFMSSAKIRNILFICFSILALIAAIYHSVSVFYPMNNSPVYRHILFSIISFCCAYFFIKRNKYFIYFFIVLVIQQYYSHGSYLVKMWSEQNKIHWISVGILLFFPTALFCLIADYKFKKIQESFYNGCDQHV